MAAAVINLFEFCHFSKKWLFIFVIIKSKDMQTKRVKKCEISLFMGSIDEVTRKKIPLHVITHHVQKCQDDFGCIYPARISENIFVSGSEYEEHGYEITIAALSWLSARFDHKSLSFFAATLAKYMLDKCNQSRVCISDDFNSSMTTFYNKKIEEKNECKI